MSPDRATADRLGEYLDAVVSGEAPRSNGLDPAIAATAARFFAADDAPGPPPGLAEHLWQQLSARAEMEKTVPHVVAAPPGSNGHVPLPPRHVAPPRGGSSALAFLATAALIVLTLVGGVLVSRGTLLLVRPDQQAAIIPATEHTPPSLLPSSGVAEVTLLHAMLEDLPVSGQSEHLALSRYHLAPGATQSIGSQMDSGVGLDVFIVESGQVTVEADAPVKVTRAIADSIAAPSLAKPLSAIVLNAGDQLSAPYGVSFRRRNDGSTMATTLDFSIRASRDTGKAAPLPEGVSFAPGFPNTIPAAVSAASAEATVQRLTLPPGAELAVRDLPGLELVFVENGTLEVVDGTRGLATATGSATIGAGSGTAAFSRAPDEAVLVNRGGEPLVILAAAIVPANASEATPPPAWSDGWGSGDLVEE